jgi:hypothetical protein
VMVVGKQSAPGIAFWGASEERAYRGRRAVRETEVRERVNFNTPRPGLTATGVRP